MANIFSETLTAQRRKAGYETAYKFYHGSGGKGVLKMSYRNYLMAEEGRILPQLSKLNLFVWALHLDFSGEEAGALVAAWLKVTAGEATYADLLEPHLARARTAPLNPVQRAIRINVREKCTHISVEQMEVIYASLPNYRCFLALMNDPSPRSPEELAAAAKVSQAGARAAVKALAAVKIARRARDGRYRGASEGPGGCRSRLVYYTSGLVTR